MSGVTLALMRHKKKQREVNSFVRQTHESDAHACRHTTQSLIAFVASASRSAMTRVKKGIAPARSLPPITRQRARSDAINSGRTSFTSAFEKFSSTLTSFGSIKKS